MNLVTLDNLMLGPFNKLSMEIPLNSFVIIAGSNNSGKSLLLKVLASLVNFKGKVSYDKNIIKSSNDIAYFSNYVFNFSNVLKTIRYPLECLGLDDDKINKLVKDVSKDMKITKLLDSKINNLTYYEKLRVALASFLIGNPKLLILDDPCLYLSTLEKEEFMGILEQLRSRGITIIMTCSSLEEVVYTINSTLYILDNGKIVSSGDYFKVLSDDSLINKAGLELPFMVDLSVKLQYYNLVDKINLSPLGMVMSLWK